MNFTLVHTELLLLSRFGLEGVFFRSRARRALRFAIWLWVLRIFHSRNKKNCDLCVEKHVYFRHIDRQKPQRQSDPHNLDKSKWVDSSGRGSYFCNELVGPLFAPFDTKFRLRRGKGRIRHAARFYH